MTNSEPPPPIDTSPRSYGEFDAIGDGIAQEFKPTQPRLDHPLFHYTSLDAFRSIIESSCVWATHIAYLNDASELAYGRNLLAALVEKLIVGEQSPLARKFLEAVSHADAPFGSASELYVICFCQEGDLLSQWRGYGGRGAGCALGLAPDEFDGGTAPVVVLGDQVYALNGLIRRVIYDQAVQRRFLEELLSATLRVLKQLSLTSSDRHGEALLSNAVAFAQKHLNEFYLAFKNPAFREENEWRAIFPFLRSSPDEKNAFLRFKATHDCLVPYIPVRLQVKAGERQGKLPLGSVVLGPGLSTPLGMASVRRFLVNSGYSHVSVTPSVVPLR